MTLIGYWPLNEEGGDTAYDYSGNENHADLSAGGSPSVGESGVVNSNAVEFDGESDYGEIEEDDALTEFPNGLTLTIWIKPHEVPADVDGWTQIFNKGDGDTSNNDWGFRYSDDGEYFNYSLDGQSAGDTADSRPYKIQESRWHHLALIWVPGITEIFMVDGDEISRQDSTSDLNESNESVMVGGSKSTSDRRAWHSIGEARLYNRPLSKSEVQYLYNVSRRAVFISNKKQC